ncbi:dodecin [Lichenicoccus sp.]|uniref:dodecin n=1 Tax=Lichenicoccus sp. TaxID=2781899 RepID=UPI003D0DBC80
MPAHTYKVVEIVGSSEASIEDAIRGAVAKASETIRHIGWFEVMETRGHVVDGKVQHFQVTLKLGFTLEG